MKTIGVSCVPKFGLLFFWDTLMETLHGVTQKQGSIKVDLCNKSLVLNFHNTEGVQREIARMNSLGLPYQGDWLSVVPCPALGLHLRGPEFISCLR